jgi:hypothetical protein
MDNSDVIIGWINDNEIVNFTDRYIMGKSVLIDQSQDWILLNSLKKNGYIIFKFTRPLKLCKKDDLNIEAGSPFLIYAYSSVLPQGSNDITYHGSSRGTRVVNLISTSPNKEISIPNLEIFEYSVKNVILPPSDTFYYCKMIQIPTNLTQKRHILKVIQIFNSF